MSFQHNIIKEPDMSKQLKFNFNPFKEGINQVLGTLEKEIMEALWNREEGAVKDVLDALPPGKDASYSTVITVTNRMAKKGLLTKRKVGKAYLYKPAYTKEQFLELVSKKIVEGVSGISLESALVHFVDYMAKVEPEKMDYFSQLIETKKKQQSSGVIPAGKARKI